VVLHLDPAYYPGGNFTIEARRNSATNIYIQSATLNGHPLNEARLYHADVVKGGHLVLQMGPKTQQTMGVRRIPTNQTMKSYSVQLHLVKSTSEFPLARPFPRLTCHVSWFTDRHFFALAVVVYGLSTVYSVFLWRKGFRKDDHVIIFCCSPRSGCTRWPCSQRGFSLNQCPVNNLYEATTFTAWAIVAAYLVVGLLPDCDFSARLRRR